MDINKEARSFSTLISDLTRQSSGLIRKEAELAKAEMSEKIFDVQSALITLAIGCALLVVSLFYIFDAVVYGIAEVLPPDYSPWLAALIVGSVTGLVGYFLLQEGKAKLEPKKLIPDQTIDSLQQDKNMLKEKVQ